MSRIPRIQIPDTIHLVEHGFCRDPEKGNLWDLPQHREAFGEVLTRFSYAANCIPLRKKLHPGGFLVAVLTPAADSPPPKPLTAFVPKLLHAFAITHQILTRDPHGSLWRAGRYCSCPVQSALSKGAKAFIEAFPHKPEDWSAEEFRRWCLALGTGRPLGDKAWILDLQEKLGRHDLIARPKGFPGPGPGRGRKKVAA